jgi:hypothetical protein
LQDALENHSNLFQVIIRWELDVCFYLVVHFKAECVACRQTKAPCCAKQVDETSHSTRVDRGRHLLVCDTLQPPLTSFQLVGNSIDFIKVEVAIVCHIILHENSGWIHMTAVVLSKFVNSTICRRGPSLRVCSFQGSFAAGRKASMTSQEGRLERCGLGMSCALSENISSNLVSQEKA